MELRLLGIVGSLRKASLNRALLRAVAEVLPPGVTLTEFDRIGDIPLFNSDLPATPEPVEALKAAIAGAHGLVFSVPEYNYSVPGSLKNAIDWASRPPATTPLRGKPVGIVGSSIGMSGSMRAQYHLRQILLYSNNPVLAQPEVLIPKAKERFDDELRLVDESTRELLRAFGVALVDHVKRYPAAA
jgi:chromate reductase, NAD(P)H dehydrogenase (quinone)